MWRFFRYDVTWASTTTTKLPALPIKRYQYQSIGTLLSNKVILGILAFRDRNAGSQNNRNRPTDGPSDRAPPAAHRNRDTRGNNIRDDRHSRTDRA